jgi:hypothetical protein
MFDGHHGLLLSGSQVGVIAQLKEWPINLRNRVNSLSVSRLGPLEALE